MRQLDIMKPSVLYRAYKDYAYMYEYLLNKEDCRAVTNEELRSRRDYILKNKINQRDEISTICWILGEEDVREKDKY
jgi:hypothetical protein